MLRLSLYRRHPLGKRPCCVAQVMDGMRKVAKIRRFRARLEAA